MERIIEEWIKAYDASIIRQSIHRVELIRLIRKSYVRFVAEISSRVEPFFRNRRLNRTERLTTGVEETIADECDDKDPYSSNITAKIWIHAGREMI